MFEKEHFYTFFSCSDPKTNLFSLLLLLEIILKRNNLLTFNFLSNILSLNIFSSVYICVSNAVNLARFTAASTSSLSLVVSKKKTKKSFINFQNSSVFFSSFFSSDRFDIRT